MFSVRWVRAGQSVSSFMILTLTVDNTINKNTVRAKSLFYNQIWSARSFNSKFGVYFECPICVFTLCFFSILVNGIILIILLVLTILLTVYRAASEELSPPTMTDSTSPRY